MSKSKIGIGTIDINKKFKNKEEAIKYAKRLKQFIYDLSKRKGWQVTAMIGISRLAKDSSDISYEISKKRGRPKKIVKIYDGWSKNSYLVDWHLHLIIISKPSYAFRNEIKRYIDKNWKDIRNEHKVPKFDVGKKKVYKKKCNIKLTDYFIWQSEEVMFCNYNFSNEEDFKYSIKQYYYGYLKKRSATIRLMEKNKETKMSEEKYLKCLNKIESKFLDIQNYFFEFSKEDDEKMQREFMKRVRLEKIIENYNKIQNNNSIRRQMIDEEASL